MAKILLIEDDVDYGTLVDKLLKSEGYEVDFVEKAAVGVNLATNKKYDLIITDLGLDTINGFQVIELIKRENVSTKIILLTASAIDSDEIKGLQLGADDYIRKSTSFEVMLQRIQHVLKSATIEKVKDENYTYCKSEELKINNKLREVFKGDEHIHLTLLEFDLLKYFLTNKNELLPREAILEDVWKVEAETTNISHRTVDTYVKNLRAKLGLKSIHSVRGIGYRWYEKE